MARLVSLLGFQPGPSTAMDPYGTTTSGSPSPVFGSAPATAPSLSGGRTIATGTVNANGTRAYFQILNADGSAASPQILAKGSSQYESQTIDSYAVTTDGNIVVTVDDRQNSTSGGLGFAVYDTNGNPISGYVGEGAYQGANSASGAIGVRALTDGDFDISTYSQSSYPGGHTQTSSGDETYSIVDDAKFGTSNADTLTATSAGRTFLEGYDGNDTLVAGTGEARMVGDGGNDTFYAPTNGAFAKMFGGVGDDTFYVYSAAQEIYEFPNQGNDREISSVSNAVAPNVETLQLAQGSAATAAVAASGNHTLIGNGNDDVFVAQNGVDTLVGGSGNNIYNVDNSQDSIVQAANGTTSVVYASADFVLSPNLTDLHLVEGSAARVAIGNAGNNSLYANSTGDVLNGLGGDDALYGGAGTDTFQFSQTNFGHQTVVGFDPSQDSLSFARSIFSDYGALGGHLAQSGSDVLVVTGDPNNYVTLKNTQLSSLSARDFSFFGSNSASS